MTPPPTTYDVFTAERAEYLARPPPDGCTFDYTFRPPPISDPICENERDGLPKEFTVKDPVQIAVKACEMASKRQAEFCKDFAERVRRYFLERGVCAKIVCTEDTCGKGTKKTTIDKNMNNPCAAAAKRRRRRGCAPCSSTKRRR
jgi:hypothetical protein